MRRLTLLLLSIAALSTAAQSSSLQIADHSDGACANADQKQTLDRPDILQHPDIVLKPPPPLPDAITAPRLIYSADSRFPSDTPKGPFSGNIKVALLVDTQGMPQQIHVEQSLGPSFDKEAIAAVQKYRFSPALQHGKPVPIKICVELAYRK